MGKIIVLICFTISILCFGIFAFLSWGLMQKPRAQWEVKSIDVMKYSRDLSREKNEERAFDAVIDRQVRDISETGATHIAIGTPYDDEFLPFLHRWVTAARRYNLRVWFRGNFAGWEGWFGYSQISRDEHVEKLERFITKNPDLFQDGDLFSTCPECENGGPGDPRLTRDVSGHRDFLIQEYNVASRAFYKINRQVAANYFSMNADVAKLIMNPETTLALGGIVVIDHYVATPTQLVTDINEIARLSRGKIVLGEFGAPIPDIHGKMTEAEQAIWLDKTLAYIAATPEVVGLNYWVSVGGTTQLWDEGGHNRKAVGIMQKWYR